MSDPQTTDMAGMKFNHGVVKKLVIGTAFYEVKAYSPYVTSLVDTIKALDFIKLPWDYYELSGDSYVDRAKNSLVNRFMDDAEASHLMIIDSDESWDVKGFLRVLRAAMCGAELVGGSYPCKNNWGFFGCIPKTMVDPDDGLVYPIGYECGDIRLIECHCVPGGFLIYSKAAFKRTEPALKTYRSVDITNGNREVTSVEYFRCNIEEDGGRIGEDVYFQKRFQECGGKVYLEPNVTIGHYGVQRWQGNFQEKLLKDRADYEQVQTVSDAFDQLNAGIDQLDGIVKNLDNPEYVDALKAKIAEKRKAQEANECASA